MMWNLWLFLIEFFKGKTVRNEIQSDKAVFKVWETKRQYPAEKHILNEPKIVG